MNITDSEISALVKQIKKDPDEALQYKEGFISQGQYGLVLEYSLKNNTEKSVLVKIVTDDFPYTDVNVEYYISFILNKLIKNNINFLKIYDIFHCKTGNDHDFSKTPMCLKDGIHDTPFIIMEKINGVTWYDFLEDLNKISIEVFCGIILQVYYSLLLGGVIGFSHNDLHSENVLIETLDKPINICYKIKSKTYMLYNQHYRAVLIDFGMANLKKFGYYNILYNNNPIRDLEKIIFTKYMLNSVLMYINNPIMQLLMKYELPFTIKNYEKKIIKELQKNSYKKPKKQLKTITVSLEKNLKALHEFANNHKQQPMDNQKQIPKNPRLPIIHRKQMPDNNNDNLV